jgi:hypothetical protein
MRTAPVPAVDANAYVYFNPPRDTAFSSDALGVGGLTLQSAAFLLADDSEGVAARFIIGPHGHISSQGDKPGGWIDVDSTSFRFGPASPWGGRVRAAWAQQSFESFAVRYPGVWGDLQSMPQVPPYPPIAAGFVRNFGPLLEHMIGKAGIAVPSLTEGLSLARVGNIAFVAYANDFDQLPARLEPGSLRNLDVSILAVAESSYPAFVVSRLLDEFVSALGLDLIEVATATAYQREVSDDIHAVVLRDGTSLFFAIAPTAEGAISLIETVVTTGGTR